MPIRYDCTVPARATPTRRPRRPARDEGDGIDEARVVLAVLDGFGLPVVLASRRSPPAAADRDLCTLATVLDCLALAG